MPSEPIKRNRYSEPPFTEGDFSARNFDEDFNEFHLPLNRMQLANFQEWGVAQGLEVSGSIGGTTLTIAPGVAVDIRGQLISLSLEGKGDIGSNPPRGEHEEVDVPVELKELSGSDQAEDTAYFVTIQFSQILRFSEGPLGRYEYVPWVSLQSVEGFTDDGISVILARVVISSNGELTELQAQGRRLVGKTVQELLLRRPQVTGEQVGQVSAGKIAATENGLQISVTDTEKEVLLSQENGNSFSHLEVRAENSIFRGELKVNRDLQVEGAIASSSLSVTGNTNIEGKLHVNGNSTIIGGNFSSTTLRIEATDNTQAPARTAAIELHGYAGRGKGLYFSDLEDDLHPHRYDKWFIGEGYDYRGIGIGYINTENIDGNPKTEYSENAKFFINTDGNVGIGTTTPSQKLEVNGAIRANRYYDDNTNFYIDTNSTSIMNVIRASIIYDREDTNFFVNPGGWSNFRRIFLGNNHQVLGNQNILNIRANTNYPAFYIEQRGTGQTITAVAPTNGIAAFLEGTVFIGGHDKVTGNNNALNVRATSAYPGAWIGNNGSGHALWVNGRAGGTTGWNSGSDIRLKKDICPLENAIDMVNALRGVSFQWRTDEFPDKNLPVGESIGLIAQEVEKVFPFLVSESEGDKGLEYAKLVAVLIEAVKEQQTMIIKQGEKLQEMQQQITDIQFSPVSC